MAEASLVIEPLTDKMISAGTELLARLKALKVEVVAAFWHFTSDAGEWRLALATPSVDSEGPKELYGRIWSAVFEWETAPPSGLDFQRVVVLSPSDSLVRALANANKLIALHERLMFNTRLGGEYFEGVYIYFISRSVKPLPGSYRVSR